MPIEITGFLILSLIIVLVAVVFASQGIKVVPQQTAWVVERLGKFHAVLSPGLNFIIPFIDRVAYRHSLKEIPLDTPSQVCITRDNTQLTVDGVLFFQVTDPQRASYGTSNYIIAVTQLAQTTLRSVVGKMELDKTFEERDLINKSVVSAIDEAALNWGVKVLRYEIKDLTPPAVILQAMQQQITAEREKRAVVAASEGRKLKSTKQKVRQQQRSLLLRLLPKHFAALLKLLRLLAAQLRSACRWPKSMLQRSGSWPAPTIR